MEMPASTTRSTTVRGFSRSSAMSASSGQRSRGAPDSGGATAAPRRASTSRRGYQAEPIAPRIGRSRQSFSSCRTLNSLANPSMAAASRRLRWSSNPDGGLMDLRATAGMGTDDHPTPMARIRQISSSAVHRASIGIHRDSSGFHRASIAGCRKLEQEHAAPRGRLRAWVGNRPEVGIKPPLRMELPTALVAQKPALSPSEIFRGRNLFILGSTGFVGKVLLSMLLDRFPDIGRAYVMVRRGSGTDSEARFWQSVVTSPAFDPLRAKHGGAEGLAKLLRGKVVVVDGDITEPNLGLSEEEAERVAKDIDVLINSSGRVTFNPPLESAMRTNVEGTKNVIAFAKRMRRPALIHTSTCFVAGNRSG